MRRRLPLFLAGLLALTSLASGSRGATQAPWAITDLGTLGGPHSWAETINERGQVVGWSETARKDSHGRFVKHAFLWENGRMRDLGALGVHDGLEASQALALNERGQVVGETSTSSSERHAFLLERGRMRDLGSLSRGSLSSATAINESGLVLGENEDPDGPDRAVVWRAGRIGALTTDSTPVAVNDRGQVLLDALLGPLLWRAGDVRPLLALESDTFPVDLSNRGEVAATLSALGMGVPRAAIWTNGKVRTLGRLGARGCDAWDLNEGGAVAGLCRDEQRRDQPVVWRDDQPTRIGIVWGDRGLALALNDAGQVTGYTRRPGSGCRCHAFVWERGRTIDLGTLGGHESSASAINNRGQIIGVADTRAGRTHAVLWTVKR